MSMATMSDLEEQIPKSKRVKTETQPTLGFSDEDMIRTYQPHDDASVVALRIVGYDVKRVLVEQWSGVEIMYPELYKGLNLKSEVLSKYDSPLVGFDGRTATPKGMIRLPVQTRDEVIEVEFIMVDAYSTYTNILARPWLHAIGTVSSTLHMKVKYPTEGQVGELVGSQAMARQCLVVAIRHQSSSGVLLG